MGRTLPPRLSLPEAEAALSPPHMSITKSFRFLDLPKEIRIMVYEELHPVTRRQNVHLQDGQDHLTLIYTTIPGISILATSRHLHSEASYILAPHVQKIVAVPPTIAIRADQLLGLVDLRDSFAIPRTFWDWFLRHLKRSNPSCMKNIRRYRAGILSDDEFRIRLNTKAFTRNVDTRTLEALTAFILRTIKYIGTKPDTMYKYPPLTVVIVISNNFQGLPVTTITTKAKRVCYKIMFPLTPAPPLVRIGQSDLPWLLHRFVYHACWAGNWRSLVSYSVKIRFLDAEQASVGWPAGYLPESALHVAIIKGVRDARQMGKGVLYYAGMVQERVEDEL
jgi:hypothetical protein